MAFARADDPGEIGLGARDHESERALDAPGLRERLARGREERG
jgi:hypothetical protein